MYHVRDKMSDHRCTVPSITLRKTIAFDDMGAVWQALSASEDRTMDINFGNADLGLVTTPDASS